MLGIIILLAIIIIIFIFILLLCENKQSEHFDPISPYRINLIDSEWMDQAPRHVRFNHGMGIMYVSNKPPTESICNNIKCPKYIDKLATLGDNNHCWMC